MVLVWPTALELQIAMHNPLGRITPPKPAARILLVEDEPLIAVTLQDELAESGFDVTLAKDGLEAIRLVAQEEFTAVITDLRMPGADGLQVLRAARRRHQDMKVLVITGYASDYREAIIREGASAILEKPFANGRVVAWAQEGVL